MPSETLTVFSTVITAIVLYFVVSGFFVGLIRGWKRSLIRFVWLFACFIICMLLTTSLTPKLMDVDFSFLNITSGDIQLTTIREFVSTILQAQLNVTAEDLASSIDFAIAMVSLVLNGVFFVLFFFILKEVTFVLFKIVNAIFIHDKYKPKKRLFGGLIGLTTGVLVAATIFMPLTGYSYMYEQLAVGSEESQSISPLSEGIEQDNSISSASESDDTLKSLVNIYKTNAIISVMDKIGIGDLQFMVFSTITTTTYNDTTIVLTDEIVELQTIVNALKQFENFDFDAIANGTASAEQLTEISESFSVMLDSKIVQAGIQSVMPMAKAFIQNKDFGESEMMKSLKTLLVNTVDRLSYLEGEKIKTSLTTIMDLMIEVLPVMQAEDITALPFEKIGEKLDAVIADGLVNRSDINAITVTFIDSTFASIDETSEFYQTAQTIKNSFSSFTGSFKTEFAALTKLVSVKEYLMDNDGVDFDFATEGSKLGKVLDETLACNSEIITRQLITDFITSFIDSIKIDNNYVSVETIKTRLTKDFSFETELGYIGKAIKLASQTDFSNLINDSSFAEELDEIAPSVLIGDCGLVVISQTFNSYSSSDDNNNITNIIDVIKNNFEDIKENNAKVMGKQTGYTYSEIINAFSEMYNALTSSAKIIDKVTESGTFDSTIASEYESVLSSLQNNIIVQPNGSRKVASYVTSEIKNIVTQQKENLQAYNLGEIIQPAIDELTSLENKISLYLSYLETYENSTQNEPYADENANYVIKGENGEFSVVSDDGDDCTRINKPFTYLCELFTAAVNKATSFLPF